MVTIFLKTSDNKWYLTISSVVFAVVAVAHLGLILLQMPASIGGYVVPYEVNAIVVIGLGYLATRGIMAARKL